MSDEKELIERIKLGEHAAYNILAKKYLDKIYWHARRMLGNHLDADEVTQEVLIVIYNKIKSFNYESSFYTWVYKITSTRCLNFIRKQNIKRFFSFDMFDELGDNGNFEENLIDNIENKEKLKKLDEILKTLPVKQRQIFILRHYDELSYDEIAKITGKKVGTLKANYFHALNKILERIK